MRKDRRDFLKKAGTAAAAAPAAAVILSASAKQAAAGTDNIGISGQTRLPLDDDIPTGSV